VLKSYHNYIKYSIHIIFFIASTEIAACSLTRSLARLPGQDVQVISQIYRCTIPVTIRFWHIPCTPWIDCKLLKMFILFSDKSNTAHLQGCGVNSQKLPSFWSFLWISLVLSIIGWGGLLLLVFMSLPTIGPRWLFFFLFTLALSGIAMPVTYFLNRRFPSDPPVDGNVVLREGMWVGVYGSLLAWLQMGRVLTLALGLVLGLGLGLVEILLRMSERSQWPHAQASSAAEEEEESKYDQDEDEND
jgi:hypothetical protein